MCRNTVYVRVVILAFRSQGRNHFAADFIIKSNDDQTLKYRPPDDARWSECPDIAVLQIKVCFFVCAKNVLIYDLDRLWLLIK